MEGVIRESALAELILVNAEVFARWRRKYSETMPRHIRGKAIFYPHDEADAWLERRCVNTTPRDVPTVALLLSGRIKLLRPREAFEQISRQRRISDSLMWELVVREAWPALVLPGGTERRYFAHHIDEVSRPQPDIPSYTVKQVEHILGLGNTRVFRYLQSGYLKALPSAGGSPRKITEQSLVMLLRTMLPARYNPYLWLRLRATYQTPLISPHRAGAMLDVSGQRVRKMIAAGTIPALTSGREQRIPVEAVEFLRPRMPAYPKRKGAGDE